VAHLRESSPDSGIGVQVEVVETFYKNKKEDRLVVREALEARHLAPAVRVATLRWPPECAGHPGQTELHGPEEAEPI